tara:strand:- start:379 stop:684 length:306 start_codon:yes stop_codon:yes gene_type:complete
MPDIELDRVHSKLDELVSAQNAIKVTVAGQYANQKNHQKIMERFLNNTWPGVIVKIDCNSTRIAKIELDIARIKTMVVVWGSFITVFIALSIPFISYYLDK